MDSLKDQLAKLARDEKITMKHLQLCVHCGKIGHLGYTCQSVWKFMDEERIEEAVRLLDAYKRENNIREADEERVNSLNSLLDIKLAVIDGKDPLSCQINRLRLRHKVKAFFNKSFVPLKTLKKAYKTFVKS